MFFILFFNDIIDSSHKFVMTSKFCHLDCISGSILTLTVFLKSPKKLKFKKLNFDTKDSLPINYVYN